MGLFGKKDSTSQSGNSRLAQAATIILTCNSIPAHDKASYWYEVSINENIVGRVEQNGVPTPFATQMEKNILMLILNIKDNRGHITKYPTPKKEIQVRSGETMRVLHDKRRFIIESGE